MKLLFIIDNLRAGGKERQLIEIIKGIRVLEKFYIGVITFNKNCHYSDFVKRNVDYFVELKKRPTRFEPVFTIWKHFKIFNPDIVHTWDALSTFYAYLPCKIFNIKLINGSIRDSGVDKGLFYYFKRFFLKKADLVVANSKAGLLYYKINGQVLYNAIDLNRFLPKTNNSSFNIIMVANFTDYKDHKTFINASIKLAKNNIIDNIYLVGDGKYKPIFKEMIPAFLKDRFIFTGSVSNVEEYLNKCEVGVLCSSNKYREGISNSILEYMAARLIVVATDNGGTNEIIVDNYNGFLIKAEDPEGLFEKIKYIKDNYKRLEHLKDNAMKVLREKFDYDKNINTLIRIYENLINKD